MHEVMKVTPQTNYRLIAEFENGEKRIADIKPLLSKPSFKALEDESLFRAMYIEYGAVTWKKPNGCEVDICPDKLYMVSVPIEQTDIV